MIPSQMLKGTLEGCILGILSQKETYGYEISSQLAAYGFGTIPEGTIYPLLLRLEKNGLVSAAFRPSELGPKRKYYSLTPAGGGGAPAIHSKLQRAVSSGGQSALRPERRC